MASLARQSVWRTREVLVDCPAPRVSLWQRTVYEKTQELGGDQMTTVRCEVETGSLGQPAGEPARLEHAT